MNGKINVLESKFIQGGKPTMGYVWMLCRTCLFALIMAGSLSSCASLSGTINPGEYRSGERASEAVAKQDAMKEHCINVSPGYRLLMFKHRARHLDAMEANVTPSYISGFKNGYRRYFREYMDLYCGE